MLPFPQHTQLKSQFFRWQWVVAAAFGAFAGGRRLPAQTSRDTELTGRQLFVAACANCHGNDGRGNSRTEVAFPEALPDFSDCSYASRENAQDWFAVVHEGGPVRAFAKRMPSFGGALSREQIERVVAYVRSICTDRSWPRGELNLPRPMTAEKAFPEDELVLSMRSASSEGTRTTEATFVYEKRFGARNQMEYDIPFVLHRTQRDGKAVNSGIKLGDIGVAYKRALFHDADRGYILSGGVELVLPTGDTASSAGEGVTIFEPFVLAAKTLPANSYLQMHAGFETPIGPRRVADAAFVRGSLGTTFTSGYGRTFSPMVEFVADRDFTRGAITEWDLVPHLQVSLSRRQHILASVGARLPMTSKSSRPRELVAYIIWDWFDGGLFSAWR